MIHEPRVHIQRQGSVLFTIRINPLNTSSFLHLQNQFLSGFLDLNFHHVSAMGDAENALPPSKKRAAGRELSRDNPGLDDEEEVCDQEAGTFKKASDEVLANRRIVKVRRNRTVTAPAAPSSNPFASIQLVPPTISTSTPVAVANVQGSQDNAKEEAAKEGGGGEEPESKVDEVEHHDVVSVAEGKKLESADAESAKTEVEYEAKKTESKVDEVKSDEVVCEESKKLDSADAESAKEEAECEAKKAENEEVDDDAKNSTEKAAAVSSFQQLSSTQNAFTGIVGTGFSSSSFSFGSITKGEQPSFPSFSFGTNGNSSLFGAVSDNTEASKTPIKKVEVETGEENEKAVFTADSVLFEFIDGGWKERGKGELKVNVSTTGNEKGRLVMRAKGNYRLILNASLFPDMKLTNMEKKGITFACLNSTSEGKDGLSTFALKFKDPAIVEEFRAVVTQHKGLNTNTNTNAAVPSLKTPENSP